MCWSGSCAGVRKRVITLRKAIVELSSTAAKEEVELRFIDTSSKMGHGRFQTKEEKKAWYGKSKKDRLREAAAKAKDRAARLARGEEVDDETEEVDADRFLSKNAKKRKRKGSKKKGSGKKEKGAKKKTQRKD